ncbi:MAG: 3'(2'),5'-bisphosphate nucleotidase CysQ [Dongiaceae bacterium]
MTQPTVRTAVDEALLSEVEAIAERAGRIILRYYTPDIQFRAKADASPVTTADEAAEAAIVPALQRLMPDVPVVSEEAVAAGHRPTVHGPENPSNRFWLVDPLDGTKEFLSRNGEFTVNIALIDGERPLLGVVHIPVLSVTYGGIVGVTARVLRGDGARLAIACRQVPADGAIVLSSRSHGDDAALDAYLAGKNIAGQRTAGSALKFCLVAEGVADLYPRLGRTMEWDTAAGHAILLAAGGSVTTMNGPDLVYGKADFANPHFVAQCRRR